MSIHFDTAEYEISHDKSPEGRGSWAFQVTEINGHSGESGVFFSPSLTLTDAKKWARQKAIDFAAAEFGHTENVQDVTIAILP
jgi:hypothetical protein